MCDWWHWWLICLFLFLFPPSLNGIFFLLFDCTIILLQYYITVILFTLLVCRESLTAGWLCCASRNFDWLSYDTKVRGVVFLWLFWGIMTQQQKQQKYMIGRQFGICFFHVHTVVNILPVLLLNTLLLLCGDSRKSFWATIDMTLKYSSLLLGISTNNMFPCLLKPPVFVTSRHATKREVKQRTSTECRPWWLSTSPSLKEKKEMSPTVNYSSINSSPFRQRSEQQRRRPGRRHEQPVKSQHVHLHFPVEFPSFFFFFPAANTSSAQLLTLVWHILLLLLLSIISPAHAIKPCRKTTLKYTLKKENLPVLSPITPDT